MQGLSPCALPVRNAASAQADKCCQRLAVRIFYKVRFLIEFRSNDPVSSSSTVCCLYLLSFKRLLSVNTVKALFDPAGAIAVKPRLRIRFTGGACRKRLFNKAHSFSRSRQAMDMKLLYVPFCGTRSNSAASRCAVRGGISLFVKPGSAFPQGPIPRRALTSASHPQGYTKKYPFSRKKSCEPSQNQDNPQFFCFISRSFIRFSKCGGPITRSVGPNESTRITISVSSSLS